MAWQIIKQPNGNFAIWSTVVDDLVVLDCTPAEVVDEFVEKYRRTTERDVARITDLLNEGCKPYYQFTKTWEEALADIRGLHGDGAESLRMIAAMDEPPGKEPPHADTDEG